MAHTGHPQVKYNYITYFEKAIDTTRDPLFYNCSFIWHKSLIIFFTIHMMVNEF
jgi:hypothetical protein